MTAIRIPLAALTLAAASILVATGIATQSEPVKAPVSITWSAADPVMAGTATTSTTTPYKFSTVIGGQPVRWNPCTPIQWQFRTTGAPTGVGSVVKATVDRVSRATGIPFVYKGTTTATPTSAWLPTSTANVRPLLIGWTDGTRSDLLRNRPKSVLAVARTAYFGGTVDGKQIAVTKAAVIALDRTDRLPLTGAVSWKTTLLHELAHIMGLDHVTNTSQLMYPVLGRSLTDFNAGDRQGLTKLGKVAGCVDIGY